MEIKNSAPDQADPTIKQCASVLGLHEFSLFSRIQAGDITAARLPSGIMAIPVSELERLSKLLHQSLAIPTDESKPVLPDVRLGIKRDSFSGFRRGGEHQEYSVLGDFRHFTESEMQGYRTAFSAIANEVASLTGLKKQLNESSAVTPSPQKEICTSPLGVWPVHSTLLNLGYSDILLCQRQNESAVIERFRGNSPYAKANGIAQILLQGNDVRELAAAFHANAKHTLEFMASNQVATAQKVIWEQFPDHRPARVVAAISERCRLAVSNEETISEARKMNQSNGRGMRI